MRLFIAACLLGASATQIVPAPRWKLIVRTRDIAMSIDSARIDSSRTDGMIGIRLRFEYAKPQPVPGDAQHVYTELQVQLALDCHAELVRNLMFDLIAPTSQRVGGMSFDAAATPLTFATHPFGHGTFIGICGWLHAPGRFQPVIQDTSLVAH
jgi:hypothetical protein